MEWFALAFAAQAAFGFGTYRDPMDDSATFMAQVRGSDGSLLSIECGAQTSGEMAVRIVPGRQLYSSGQFSGLATYKDRVRFDQKPAVKFGFRYAGKEAYLFGQAAIDFIGEAKVSQKVTLELSDWRNDTFIITLPLARATESIARVRASCSAPR